LPNAWTEARFGHVWEGEYDKQTNKLKGGMHTKAGLDEFKKMNINANRVFNEASVNEFKAGKNLTSTIYMQELPNHVVRVHLPDEGINKKTRQRATVTNVNGEEIKGIKTLFPFNWTEIDVKNAGQAVINQQNGPIKSGAITGTYKGVKVEAYLDEKSGIINSIFPSWDQ
jgi:hypothetical protein